jgi:hypothetical protein
LHILFCGCCAWHGGNQGCLFVIPQEVHESTTNVCYSTKEVEA